MRSIKKIFFILILFASRHAFAQDSSQVMLKPLYYQAQKGENIRIVAKKYRLKEQVLASRNRIPPHKIFKIPTPVLVGYSVVPFNQRAMPPDNAFLVDREAAASYSLLPESFLADSLTLSATVISRLLEQPVETEEPKTENVLKEEQAQTSGPLTAAEIAAQETPLPEADTTGDDPRVNNIAPETQTGTIENYFAERIREIEEGNADSLNAEIDFFESPIGWAAQGYKNQATIIQRGLIILAFFIFCNISLFIVIISSRIYKSYLELRTKKLVEVYEPLLANLLFGEYDNEEKRAHIVRRIKKRYLVNEFNNEVFMAELLNLHKNFSGDVCDDIRNLYLEFNLLKFSMRKLKAFPWDVKIKGIRELTQMDIKDAYDEIFKYVDSKNSILRLETLLSLIQLSESDPLKFLSNTKAKMTGWQQVNILAILSILNTDDLPDFKRWLNSPNDSVALFTIRMINHFKQINSISSIVPMLDDPREEIREAVVQTIGNLELYGFAQQLIEVYGKEQDRMKVMMLQVMTKISDEEQIPFFKEELFNPNFDIALNAAISMVKTGKEGEETVRQLLVDADDRTRRIIMHALDKRIVK